MTGPAARIGKYELVELLGEGGMGQVWKARDTDLGRWVAVKLLKNPEPEERARFRREAETAARLSHPNIAAVYEAGDTFIAMQLIDGRTLAAMPRGDPRTLALRVRDAALAAHHAHRQGVIHRDIKPANIMIESAGGGRVFVTDFGLARGMTVDSRLSASGVVVGTPAYMSPEQARGAPLDARTDVYSLGATLYDAWRDARRSWRRMSTSSCDGSSRTSLAR
jgi:serine/threonine protein kinase